MDDQFADAPHDDTVPQSPQPLPSGAHQDHADLSSLSEFDFYDSSEDEREWIAQYGEHSINDEDWELAEKDFTKQYNRLRQHSALSQGQSANALPVLPAINRPKPTKPSQAKEVTAERKRELDKRLTDQLTRLSKYASRLADIDVPYTQKPGHQDSRLGVSVNRKGPSANANIKDKADRATTEQVLDARTRIILYKMIGRELIKEINGCVSTGKEANVYHALTPDSQHLALKIYKTSILIFKDRDKYVTGEFRFRRGYSRHNPRKMVRIWAEKEMRNLKRLNAAGVRVPEVFEVRENVLVMQFLGDQEGWASPRLKDANIPSERYTQLYLSLMCTVRKMYHECKLIHADMSEYNILYHQDSLWIIDVSQSVEHDHPAALEFLRKDVKNVIAFFRTFGVACLGLKKSFEFVITERLEGAGVEEEEEEVLKRWIEKEREDGDEREAEEESEEVFLKKFIPRSLTEILDPEKEIAKAKETNETAPPSTKAEVVKSSTRVRFTGVPKGEDETSEEQDEQEEESGEEGNNGAEERIEKKPRGHRHEDREAKKERKKAVKEEQRAKRQTKMPKAEKKKRIKNTRG